MRRVEITPFTDEHLDGAAVLLAERHRRHRSAEPLLPGRFEDPDEARPEIEVTWRREGASGAVARSGEEVVGYLIGAPRDEAVWGPNVWVELAGHAAAEAELVRDLYARAAERWVEEGRADHYALVPATDSKLVEAWFRVGFGQQAAHGIREVPPAVEQKAPPGVEVLPAGTEDLEALVELDPLIGEQLAGSPVFSRYRSGQSAEELREDWREGLEATDEGIFVARRDRRARGTMVVVPVERSSKHDGLGRPEGACLLGFAATAPEERGSGLGLALTEAVFAWAAQHGYETIVTDWRVTNLLASRFWPRRGFRTSFLRLHRFIP